MINNYPSVKEIDVEKEIAKSLYADIYKNINCRPYSEYRHNIALFPLFPTTKSNLFPVLSTSVKLPALGRWFLYSVNANAIMDIDLPKLNEWMSMIDYCNTYKVDIRFLLVNSDAVIPRGFIYMIRSPRKNEFIFAIKQDGLNNLVNSSDDKNKPGSIDLNIYYHKKEEEFYIKDYSNNTRTSYKNNFYAAIKEKSAIPKIVFINGCEITPFNDRGDCIINITDITDDTVGEIVYDSSIVGEFNVDVSYTDENQYRISNVPRVLCHVPKIFNEKDCILTSRVCDIYVHPKKTSVNSYVDGIYVDRKNTESQFHTLTHNDFSIDHALLKSISQFHHNEPYYRIKVFVRNHNKGIYLAKEPSYLKELYMLDDDTIKAHLLGSKDIDCWKAINLENSPWTKLVDNNMENIKANSLIDGIEGLGYVNAANAVCKRVQHILVSNELSHTFYFPIPICYMNEENITAHVFINGTLVEKDNFKFHKEKQFAVIEINENIELEVGTKITLELFETQDYKSRELTLASGESVSLIIDQDYLIYKKIPVDSKNYVLNKTIYGRFEVNVSYKEFTNSEYGSFCTETRNDDNTTTLTINNSGITTLNILVVSKNAYQKIYGVERHLKELNYDIWCSKLLRIKSGLFPKVVDGVIENVDGIINAIPYLNTNKNMLVYLNGRELIKGLDYEDYSINTNYGYMCGQFVVLQNVDYLRVVSNTVEVFTVNEDVVSLDTGFLTKNSTESLNSHMAYYSNIGMLLVDGIAKQNESITDYFVDVNEDIRKGASYKIRALIPQSLKTILSKYGSTNLVDASYICNYVNSQLTTGTDLAVITRSHHIYSTFIQYVTEQILRGKFEYKMSWTDDEIKTALSAFADMQEFDISFNKQNVVKTDPAEFAKAPSQGLDYRMVDVLPSYRLEKLEDTDLDIVERRPIMVVTGSKRDYVNGNYICINSGVEYMKDITVRHINENAYKQWQGLNNHCRIGHINNYWRMYDINEREIYRAHDNLGVENIWDLKWVPVNAEDGDITINTVYIEVNTSNEFPIHRNQYTLKIEDYAFLQRVANLYINKDLAKDGMNL